MFNTPPVFSVYVSLLNMRWLKKMGGVSEIEKNNRKKAQLLYSEIDLNPLFKGYAAIEDRSTMNATFNLTNNDLKDTFESMLKEAGVNGVNGLPLVTGLVLMPGRHIIFDTPEGRIIEAFADGRISPTNILAFYKDTLPQLGWNVKSKNEFQRENEVLRIEVSANKKNQSIVRFFITPDVK